MPAQVQPSICAPANRDWLLDAGTARDYENFLRDYLHSRGIDRLDGLILSHGDSRHLGGVLPVCWRNFEPAG